MNKIYKNHHYLLLLLLLLNACGHVAPFVWVECFPKSDQSTSSFLLQPGDKIDVSVWDQAQISRSYVVREDGFITVPLVGDVYVAGLTPTEAANAIAEKLEGDIVQSPRVTVISTDAPPKYVAVLGEVSSPGQIELKPKDTLVDILAIAGGLSEFADKDSIYVFRHRAKVFRVRFDYERLVTTKTGGIRFKLQDGDVIVVE